VKLQSSIQETVISPGDYIVADLNGVVCLPKQLAERCLEAIPAIALADERCAKAIKEGMSVEGAFKTYRGK
jgi:regulator of RNase E activity RraA